MNEQKFIFDCPMCNERKISVSKENIGKKGQCPKCNEKFIIPHLEDNKKDKAAKSNIAIKKNAKQKNRPEKNKADINNTIADLKKDESKFILQKEEHNSPTRQQDRALCELIGGSVLFGAVLCCTLSSNQFE